MLTIRKEQMAAFERHLVARFETRLRRHSRSEFKAQTDGMTEEQLGAFIASSLQRGRSYGLTTERELTLFVDLLFLNSLNFDLAPERKWARTILVNPDLEGETKLSLIYQRLAAQQQPATQS
jgi:hypothetical protein